MAVAAAARGQNTVGSCVHLPANYTHHCVLSFLLRCGHKTIWQLPSPTTTKAGRKINRVQQQECTIAVKLCFHMMPVLPTVEQRFPPSQIKQL